MVFHSRPPKPPTWSNVCAPKPPRPATPPEQPKPDCDYFESLGRSTGVLRILPEKQHKQHSTEESIVANANTSEWRHTPPPGRPRHDSSADHEMQFQRKKAGEELSNNNPISTEGTSDADAQIALLQSKLDKNDFIHQETIATLKYQLTNCQNEVRHLNCMTVTLRDENTHLNARVLELQLELHAERAQNEILAKRMEDYKMSAQEAIESKCREEAKSKDLKMQLDLLSLSSSYQENLRSQPIPVGSHQAASAARVSASATPKHQLFDSAAQYSLLAPAHQRMATHDCITPLYSLLQTQFTNFSWDECLAAVKAVRPSLGMTFTPADLETAVRAYLAKFRPPQY